MRWPEPCSFQVDVNSGLMTGTSTRYQKRFRELRGLYADATACDTLVETRGNDVVYEVTDHRPNANPGDVITGVTRMSPGKVGDEFFMTRGHIHAQIDRPELYYGLKGRGLMLMESPDGESRTIEMFPHTACYVPPFWIHRSMNLGDQDFVMLFCYPADSGQDYDIIERSNGMKLRIVDDGSGGWRAVPNTGYVERSKQEVEALLQERSGLLEAS